MKNFVRINASDWSQTLSYYYGFYTGHIVKRDNVLFIEQTLTIKKDGYACLEVNLPVYDKYTDSFLLTKHIVYSLNRYFI